MSVLKYFKNTPRSSPHRATGPKCFFLQIRNEVPGKKRGACRPPQGRQGPVARWGGDRVPSPYISPGRHMSPFPLSFEPKKFRKKERGEEKKSGEALPKCVLVIYR